MKSECFFDFCFICTPLEKQENLKDAVEDELFNLFGESLHWYLDWRKNEEYEIVVAEVRGMEKWRSEEEVLFFLEERAHTEFWQWLQGYRLQVYPNQAKEKGCGGCGCH